MGAKILQFDDEGRRSILRGVEQIARAVKITVGPKGRNVILDTKFGSPTVTKDGVSVAKEIELEDPFENMGAAMVKEVGRRSGVPLRASDPQKQSFPGCLSGVGTTREK